MKSTDLPASVFPHLLNPRFEFVVSEGICQQPGDPTKFLYVRKIIYKGTDDMPTTDVVRAGKLVHPYGMLLNMSPQVTLDEVTSDRDARFEEEYWNDSYHRPCSASLCKPYNDAEYSRAREYLANAESLYEAEPNTYHKWLIEYYTEVIGFYSKWYYEHGLTASEVYVEESPPTQETEEPATQKTREPGRPQLREVQALEVLDAILMFLAYEGKKRLPFKSSTEDGDSLCNYVKKRITDKLKQAGVKDRIDKTVKYVRNRYNDLEIPTGSTTNKHLYWENKDKLMKAASRLRQDGAPGTTDG